MLVVDDDPDILKLLGMVLASEGCVVREALAPADGLGALAGVDVVLVDQRMPKMSGSAFIAAARSAGYSPIFLVISAHSEARREAERAGADGFLGKPLGVADTLREIERLFAKRVRTQGASRDAD